MPNIGTPLRISRFITCNTENHHHAAEHTTVWWIPGQEFPGPTVSMKVVLETNQTEAFVYSMPLQSVKERKRIDILVSWLFYLNFHR
jgi:hypothetical protein